MNESLAKWDPVDLSLALCVLSRTRAKMPPPNINSMQPILEKFFYQKFHHWLQWAVAVQTADSLKEACGILGISTDDVISSCFNEGEMPMHIFAVEHATKSIVIAVGGSSTFGDHPIDGLQQGVSVEHRLAGGGQLFVPCYVPAEWMYLNFTPQINEMLRTYSGYALRITGHSWGGGSAVLLACLLKQDFPSLVQCATFGAPPVASLDVCERTAYGPDFFNFILMDDIIPRWQAASTATVAHQLTEYNWAASALDSAAKARIMEAVTHQKGGGSVAGAAVTAAKSRLGGVGSFLKSKVKKGGGGNAAEVAGGAQQQQQQQQAAAHLHGAKGPEAGIPGTLYGLHRVQTTVVCNKQGQQVLKQMHPSASSFTDHSISAYGAVLTELLKIFNETS